MASSALGFAGVISSSLTFCKGYELVAVVLSHMGFALFIRRTFYYSSFCFSLVTNTSSSVGTLNGDD